MLVSMSTTTAPTITPRDLQPGDIGFGPIGGIVGLFVGLGQLFLGDEARFRHAFVVTRGPIFKAGIMVEPPLIVEAMPGGARRTTVSDRWNESHVFIRLTGVHEQMREDIAHHAIQMIGTPYGFSDYLALFLKRLGFSTPRLDRWISRTCVGYPCRAICSQLVDFAVSRAGVKVFDDGRLSQDVTPGALFYRLLRIGGQDMWPAGRTRT